MYLVEKLEKVKRSPRVYGRVSKGVEGFSEGTWKEKGTEGEGEGVVILLMPLFAQHSFILPIPLQYARVFQLPPV